MICCIGARRVAAIMFLAVVLGLLGCDNDPPSDLRIFVAQTGAEAPSPIQAMPHMPEYVPYRYVAAGRRSPFAAPVPPRPSGDDALAPDTHRPPEPLEQFSLDALTLVGTLRIAGHTYALITAPDGQVHRETLGDHLGRHDGQIIRIDAQSVALREIVASDNGGYTHRDSVLAFPPAPTP